MLLHTERTMTDPAERRLTLLLVLAAGLCGAWALGPVVWPAMFGRPHAPSVTRVILPDAQPADPAPTYATTASVAPLLSGRLDLNTATSEQIEALPGVGPALSARILAGRPYRTLADLDAVKGVGPSLLGKLAPVVALPPGP